MTLLPPKPKPNTIQHRKRVGAHHNHQSKHYKKTYWPYLPLLFVVSAGLVVSSLWTNLGHGVLGATTDINATSLLQSTNEQRTHVQEPELRLNSQLMQAAQAKAEDMASRGYWSHATPEGVQPWAFISQAGYSYRAAGENLAYGFSSSNATVSGWMNSAEHRANILNAGYRDVGFGIVDAPNYQGHGEQTVVVAMYGKPATGVALTAATSEDSAPFTSASASTQEVARVQILSGLPSWSLLVVLAAAGFAGALFIVRHLLFLRRVFVYSETWVLKHRMFDFIIVTIAVAGIVLTRTAGFIH